MIKILDTTMEVIFLIVLVTVLLVLTFTILHIVVDIRRFA